MNGLIPLIKERGVNTKRNIFSILTASALLALTLALAGCAEAPIFTCANGTARTGAAPGSINFEQCVSCDSGFRIEGARGGDALDGASCIAAAYTCQNGTPTAGSPAGNSDAPQCASCAEGFLLTESATCVIDLDNDGVLNARDVDDDGDGLIEIRTLDELNSMRFNLAGTGYRATSGGANSSSGCGNGGTATVCSGYELMRGLDFADGASYADGMVNSDWRPNNDNPDNATNSGWPSIGDTNVNNQFNTVFEGNGFTISNLYARGSVRVGLFGETAANAVLRNIGIVNYRLYGDGSNDEIGGLVGSFAGRISTSYATGDVDGGAGNDAIGGLVGSIGRANSIIASYAIGNVNGGNGTDNVSGLVGSINGNDNRIIASYAMGTVNGGSENDNVAGLIGFIFSSGGSITASYATANVDGGGGTDTVGSLLGQRVFGEISASYGFGTTSNGTATTFGTHPNSAVNSAVVLSEAGTSAPTASTTNAGPQWTNSATNPTWQWDFGTNTQNPALVVDFNGDGTATWQEFGSQPR